MKNRKHCVLSSWMFLAVHMCVAIAAQCGGLGTGSLCGNAWLEMCGMIGLGNDGLERCYPATVD